MYGIIWLPEASIGIVFGAVLATNSYNNYTKKSKELSDWNKAKWVMIEE